MATRYSDLDLKKIIRRLGTTIVSMNETTNTQRKKKSEMRAEKKISQGTKFEFFKTFGTILGDP